ncbi:hypothetical protein [Azospirillum isscasi]|uniref:Uncharacterized protein n=1 Tax=Azospirillum isscasi TaxID=3053926 RepID=A0ABU0WQB9_9PROT|nr:hypothetical protein [Azospirillum isscasi]MDQ2106437.1 hypothetical protein [Azospirillum isscasi]
MGDTYLISGLTAKRAEVSGVIADLEKRIAQHRADLVHIDAVLRLYAPEVEPESIAPKAVRKRNDWFKPGELARIVLDVLRVAPAPLQVREIAVKVMEARGIDTTDARTVQLVGKLVHNAVTRQATDLVERVGDGKIAAWRVRQGS